MTNNSVICAQIHYSENGYYFSTIDIVYTDIHAFRKDLNFCVCLQLISHISWGYPHQDGVGVDVDKCCVIQGFFFLLDSKNELQSYQEFQNNAFKQTDIYDKYANNAPCARMYRHDFYIRNWQSYASFIVSIKCHD